MANMFNAEAELKLESSAYCHTTLTTILPRSKVTRYKKQTVKANWNTSDKIINVDLLTFSMMEMEIGLRKVLMTERW